MNTSLIPDIKTLVENYVILNIVCVIVLVPIWVRNRKRFSGTGIWILSFIAMGAGMGLVSLRGMIPDFLSVVLANGLMLTGLAMSAWGLELFTGNRPSIRWSVIVVVIYIIAQTWFTYANPDIGTRRMLFSSALCILSLRIIYYTFFVVPRNLKKLIYGVGLIYIFYMVVGLAGVIKFITGTRGGEDFFRPDVFEALSIFIYEMLFFSLVFVIVIMFNNKLLVDMALQEDKFRTAFQTSPYAMVISDYLEGRITEVNSGFLKATGYEIHEVTGKRTIDLNLFEKESDRASLIEELKANGKLSDREIRFRDRAGNIFICIYSAEIIVLNGERYIISSLNNITDRKNAEHQLGEKVKELEQMNRAMMGRELRMAELKKEINSLLSKLELPAKFETPDHRLSVSEVSGFDRSGESSIIEDISRKAAINLIRDLSDEIDKRKAVETELLASKEMYRLLSENGSDVIWLFDIALNRFSYVSPSVKQLRGYTVEEVLKQSMQDAMIPESFSLVISALPARLAAFAAGDQSAVTQVHEIVQTCKDGNTVPTEVVTTLLTDDKGNITHIQGVSRDITERKKAEANMMKQIELQDRLAKIALTVPGMIYSFRVNTEGKMSLPFASEVMNDIWGFSPEELRDDFSPAFDRVHPDDKQKARKNISESLRNMLPWKDTFRVIHPVKGELWLEGHSVPKREDDGNVVWYGFVQDVTERMRIEIAMRESEKRYRELVQSANSAIIRWSSIGEILFFNDFALKFFGYTEEEINGKSIGILVPETESTGRDLTTLVNSIVADPGQYINQVNENICRDGRRVWLAWTNRAVFDTSGKVREILAVGVDITDRKRVEEELLTSRAELKTALESITDAIFISDNDGKFIDFNEAFATFHKFRNKDECARTLAEYPDFLEVTFPDGRVAPLEQWAVPRALRGESVTNAEYHLRRKDTGETWIGSYSFAPIHDLEGSVVGSVVVGRDISEEKAAELALRESEEAYRQLSEELEKRVRERTAQLENAVKELEAFSYSVSHDLRAPLRAVHSYTKILREDYDKEFDDEGKRLCSVIESSAIHMGQLIDDLLAFSRVGRTELTRDFIDMKALATSVYEDLTDHKTDGKFVFTVDDLPPAVGDHTTIRLVLTNLISNAVKYSSREEIPEIKFGFEMIEGEAIYYIRDNGVGFKMEYAGKLFGVFQRLHTIKEFEGNGVGLAIVQRIIHRHGGRVWADAVPGKGATFYFTIPAA